MTCIVGLIEEGIVHVGADSAGVGGYQLAIRADEKVFKNAETVMGFTTSFRMGQLLRYAFKPPRHHADVDLYEYMVTSFIDDVRKSLKGGGFATKEKEVETGGVFLVGYRGRLFTVYSDYQVAENVDGYEAVGCGAELALGSLFSTKGGEPKSRLETALGAAERYSAGVQGPFHFVMTER